MTRTKQLLERRSFAVFFLCRVLGVVLRPLTLLVALTLPDGQFARDYALILTTLVSSFVIYGNQNHRAAYSYFLGDTAPRKGLGGVRTILHYLDGVAVHILLFAPVVGAVVWIWTESLFLWALVMPLVLIEKYYDDHQRALIYRRRYLAWSAHFLFRTILPSGTILAMVLIWGVGSVSLYTALCLACFAIYFFMISPKFAAVMGRWLKKLVADGWAGLRARTKTYLGSYVREYLGAQVFSILAMNILVIDRYFVNSAFPDDFARYVFAVNVFATMPLIHNIFYLTRIRPKLIDVTYPVLPTIFGIRNLALPFALGLLALLAFPVLKTIGWIDRPLSSQALTGLALMYFLAAVSLIPQEFVFWRTRREALVATDLSLFALIAGVLSFSQPSLEAIPFWMALILALRIAALTAFSMTHHPRLRLPHPISKDVT
ncbi:hypothetical protein KUL25_11820 [Rhodobacteraceae bacterium N5(2021)]|uniref:Uncharacterized protein n=1 Tax=Gymnodinialimonas phycosphaerae TaxID=2841589 RepID=A0A975TRG9_9RHOB|nr:hypothetical protein [Gymnodinialimonas phycosphaerae]MBY4893452.1 hypothetical protein [Gymnodinialimonas phycosphaerae]